MIDRNCMLWAVCRVRWVVIWCNKKQQVVTLAFLCKFENGDNGNCNSFNKCLSAQLNLLTNFSALYNTSPIRAEYNPYSGISLIRIPRKKKNVLSCYPIWSKNGIVLTTSTHITSMVCRLGVRKKEFYAEKYIKRCVKMYRINEIPLYSHIPSNELEFEHYLSCCFTYVRVLRDSC